MTAQDLINAAARLIGVLDMSESLTTNDNNNAFTLLNMFVDDMSNNNIIQTAQTMITFTASSGVVSYAIGTGQTINQTPPLKVTSATYVDASDNVQSMTVYTRDEYYALTDRLTVNAPPTGVYYDEGATQQATRAGTFYLYPIPDSSTTYTIQLQCDVNFTEFTTLSSNYTFPANYELMMTTNFAILLSNNFPGCVVSTPLQTIATRSMKQIERLNDKTPVSSVGLTKSGGMFNIMTGQEN